MENPPPQASKAVGDLREPGVTNNRTAAGVRTGQAGPDEAIAGHPHVTNQNNSTLKRQCSDPEDSSMGKHHCAEVLPSAPQQQDTQQPCQDHQQQQQQPSSSSQKAAVLQLQLPSSAHTAADAPSSVPITPQLPSSRQGSDASTSTAAMQQRGLPAQPAPAPAQQHPCAGDAQHVQDLQDRHASTADAAEASGAKAAGAKAAAMLGQLVAVMGSLQDTAAAAAPAALRAAAEAVAGSWLGAPQHAAMQDTAAPAQLLAALQDAAPHYDSMSQLISAAALVFALHPQSPPAAHQPWIQSLARSARLWPGARAALRILAVRARLVVADMLPQQTWAAIVQDLLAVDRWILAGCLVDGQQTCFFPAVYEAPDGTQVRLVSYPTAAGAQEAVSIYDRSMAVAYYLDETDDDCPAMVDLEGVSPIVQLLMQQAF